MKKITMNEAANINGGFIVGAVLTGLGILGAGIAGYCGYSAVKAYNSSSMDNVNDVVCDVFGKPLPFKKCK